MCAAVEHRELVTRTLIATIVVTVYISLNRVLAGVYVLSPMQTCLHMKTCVAISQMYGIALLG